MRDLSHFHPHKYCTHIDTVPKLGSVYSCLQVVGTLLAVTAASYC